MERPRQCFLSYAHQDRKGFERLQVHLKASLQLFDVELWNDQRLTGGAPWNDRIRAAIDGSQIFVLMMTNDFLTNDYIYHHELPAIVARHKADTALVLPLIYRVCGWYGYFGKFVQAVPTQAGRLLPIRKWRDHEEALAVAADQIGLAVQDWFAIKPRSPYPLSDESAA